jgi:hypothetical protein
MKKTRKKAKAKRRQTKAIAAEVAHALAVEQARTTALALALSRAAESDAKHIRVTARLAWLGRRCGRRAYRPRGVTPGQAAGMFATALRTEQ